MTDDVRAAAERLRRYYAGDAAVYRHRDGDARFTGDVLCLLGAHPEDDGEPLTTERLEAFGFTAVENQWGGLALRVKGRARLGHDSTVPAHEQWVAFDGDGGDGIFVPDPKTVGGLRRLCAALGIPLTETPK